MLEYFAVPISAVITFSRGSHQAVTSRDKDKSIAKETSIDIARLKCPKINREFVLELKNHFAALADINYECNVDTKWKNVKETSTIVLGFIKKRNMNG